MRIILRSLFLAGILSALACTAPDRTPVGETLSDDISSKLVPAGFLSDYSNLTPSKIPDLKGAYTYRNKSKSLGIYKLVMLDPVKVHLREGAAGRKQSPEKLRDLAKFWENKILESLGDSFPVVNKPAWGVMRIRAAIVDATPNFPLTNGIDAPAVVGTTGIELEVLDSLSGEQIAAAVDSRPGKWYRLRNLTEEDGYAKNLLGEWAMLLRDGLDDVRGLHRDSEFGTLRPLFR
mgnify:CR=1 FL=1